MEKNVLLVSYQSIGIVLLKTVWNVNLDKNMIQLQKLAFVQNLAHFSLDHNAFSVSIQNILIMEKNSVCTFHIMNFMILLNNNVFIAIPRSQIFMEINASLVLYQHTGIVLPRIVWNANLDRNMIQLNFLVSVQNLVLSSLDHNV